MVLQHSLKWAGTVDRALSPGHMWVLGLAPSGGLHQSLNFSGSQFPQQNGLIISTFDLTLKKPPVFRRHKASTEMRLANEQNYAPVL